MNWAVREGLINRAPRVEQIPESPREVELPTPEETMRLVEALPDFAKPVVRLMVATGCRSGEVFNLKWENVDLERGIVHIRSVEKEKGMEKWTPKTEASKRGIPITGPLLEMLRSQPKEGPYVFPSRDDPNKPRNNVRRALDGAALRAGLTRNGQPMHITTRMLRKVFATLHAECGTPQQVLQALLGHAPGSRVTNAIYVQATEKAKRAAIERGQQIFGQPTP